MANIQIKNLYDLDKTIAKSFFDEEGYPWKLLSEIKEYILELGKTLSIDEYENPHENVWISKKAKVYPFVSITGPCIIDHEAEVRHCAFIRGNVIIGKKCVVGNSTELKNSILFDEVQLPHYNYVSDSILGYKAHLGAGAITSNLKSDKSLIKIKDTAQVIETNMQKIGAFLGDNVEIGCNSVLCPGTIVGKNTTIYPLCQVRGVIDADSIYKDKNNIIKKRL